MTLYQSFRVFRIRSEGEPEGPGTAVADSTIPLSERWEKTCAHPVCSPEGRRELRR